MRLAPTGEPHWCMFQAARACHPRHHPSLLATHALPPAIKMRSSGRCLSPFLPSFLPSATKNAHATTVTREAERRPRRDKKPSERKEKGRASEQGMPLFCGLAFNLIQPPRTPTEEGERQQSVRREGEGAQNVSATDTAIMRD